MKEQNKTPEKELSGTEIANLSDVQFKTGLSGCSENSLRMAKNKIK